MNAFKSNQKNAISLHQASIFESNNERTRQFSNKISKFNIYLNLKQYSNVLFSNLTD